MRHPPHTVWVVVCLAASAAVASAWENRHIEGEMMEMSGFRLHWNPQASYSGHGGMALSYVKIPPGTTRQPKALKLTARFAPPLPAGRYQVYVRYYDAVPKLRLALGTAAVETELPKGGRYTVVPVRTDRPGEKLTLEVLECGIRVIIDWIFVTNDPRWRAVDTHRGRRLAPAGLAAQDGPERKGNWIANASFEAGQPVDIVAPYQHNLAFYSCMADAKHHVHGAHSLRVPIVDLPWRDRFHSGSEIVYGPVPLREGGRYRLGVQMRRSAASAPVTAALSVSSKELPAPASAQAEIGTQWRQHSLDVGPVKKAGRYEIHIRLDCDREGTVWVDNLFFGVGKAFALREPIEAGPTFPRPGNVLLRGKDEAGLAVWREAGAPQKAAFEYQVYDWHDRRVMERRVDLSAAAVGRSTRPLPLPRDASGVYRMHFRTLRNGRAGPWRQVSFAVLTDTLHAPAGPIGVYGSFAPQALRIYRLAGFRSINTLSPAGHVATWNRVEPVYGKGYIFRDADVDRACKHGIHIICNINTQRRTVFPKGLPLRKGPPGPDEIGHKQGAFPAAAWRKFVSALAEHYKGRIRDYLLIDEPAYQYTPEEYFKLLKVSSEAIKSASPDSRVWMHTHTVVNPQYLEVLDRLGAHRCCDGLYDYVRTPERGRQLLAWSRKRSRPVWAVEYGGFRTFHVEQSLGRIDRPVSLRARGNVVAALESALRSFSWARAERYYRYDARFTGHRGYMTMFEADGTLKPAGVALAVLNARLAGLSPRGEIKTPDELQAFLFASDRRALLAFRHRKKRAAVVEAALKAEDVRLCDCMGKAIAPVTKGGGLRVVADRHFRYLTFAASQVDEVKAALAAAEVQPATAVEARLLRRKDGPLALQLKLTNRGDDQIEGLLCPQRKSLFHLAGYIPISPEGEALQRRLLRRVRLAAGGSATVEYPLNYAADKHFERTFPGGLLELNLESPARSEVLAVHLGELE